jgi:hypothetical protein
MNDVTRTEGPSAWSYIAIATGALAVGAIAVGAIAIGRMVIGRLAIQKVRLQTVEIDNLTVRRLRGLETIESQPGAAATGDQPPSDAIPETNGEARPAPRRRRPRKTMPN